MKVQSSPAFTHLQLDKIGVLVTNLGTPDQPTTTALRRYLAEFLADPRVVELPRLLWWLLLHGVILRIRPSRSAKSYRSVWTDQGSPLLINTSNQTRALRQALQSKWGDRVIVDFAMRYGNPSIAGVLQKMMDQGVRKLLVLPLYPQYSAATSASTFDVLGADFRNRRWLPDFRFISHYHDFGPYIEACAERIRQFQQQSGLPDKLLFSYHGVPKKYLLRGDPYHCECHKTSRLIADALGLKKNDYLTTFQSRFGREEWLQPYTDETLKSLPGMGVNHVQVFCPGFSSDCLETIEEIGVENRDYFLRAGGDRFEYIAALNDTDMHIRALTELVETNLQGWQFEEADTRFRDQRARRLGAEI